MEFKINSGGNLEIDPVEIFNSLPDDKKKEVAKNLATQDFFIEKSIDFICGEDEDGWGTGDDANLRQKLLERVEKSHLEKSNRYNWSIWRGIVDTVKSLKAEQHIYYKLYHHENKSLTIRQFMEKIKDENEFFTKRADKEIEKIESLIKEGFNNLINEQQ